MVKQRRQIRPTTTLPQELCLEILARLPAESLLRCRCVSKLWCSLIDDPCFASTHYEKCQNNQEKSRLLVLEPSDMGESKQLCTVRSRDKFRKISKFEMYTTWYEHYQAVGCINGMLCMKRYISETQVIQIFLWNPSIRKALELPSPEMLTAEVRFDIDCAFGFDHVRNDYKVVASVYIGGGLHIPRFVEIFTLSTCSWKTVNIDRGPCLWIHGCPKVFLNGIIYWSGIDILKSTVKGRFSHFVSFDVVSEVFKYIDLPDLEHPNVWEHERFPINFDQSIGLMEIFETYTQIWVLEDVEGMVQSWTKRYVINLQLLHKYIYFKMDGELFFAGEKGGVSSYNIKNQEMKVLAKSYKLSPVFTTNYMESLALLKGVPDKNSYIFPPFEVILFEDVDDV